ncbi:MAG TPA: hypothetical protein DGT23_34945 [Micromonosporaceae bacterium]|nr:hypothetical protein [Micromonosporaceae bacterium]
MALASVTALVAASLIGSPAQASHSWANYHWARTANPFTVELDDNVTSAWDTYLRTASTDWTASSKLNTVVRTGDFGSKSSCSPLSGHIEVCNAAYGSTGWLGIASISLTTGNHISRGFVKVNDTYFNQAQYNTPAWRRLVMCQEVGHGFGLDHQDENFNNANLGTCMDYTSRPAGPPSNEHPNSHDFAQLNTIYTHLDSFSSTAVALGPQLAGNHPATWGKLVHGSATHGEGYYVREYANGNKVLTIVFWAL